MNPLSLPVLGGAALVTSPALWGAVVGETPLRVGLTRYLIAVLVCWAGLSFVAMIVGPVPADQGVAGQPEDDAQAGGHQDSPTSDAESARR